MNSSGAEKLAQYEVHERLHQMYENGTMKKTVLAYHLKFAADDRHKLLKWMGSSLAPQNVPEPTLEELPKIPLRLAKIPHQYDELGDKGFHNTTRMNPNMNTTRTPYKLSSDEVVDYRRSEEMIAKDRETSYTRVPAEDNFERYRNDLILKDRVPYWNIAMLPYAHEWGHANMNLLEPVRKPGSGNTLTLIENYWDKHAEESKE